MKNVPLPHQQLIEVKEYLREAGILWRDLSRAAIIPNWGECICDEAQMIGGDSCAQYAHKLLSATYPGLSLKWRKEEMVLLNARPPLYFVGPYNGPVYHIDIIGAYSQFYRYLFLHSDFPFKRQKYPIWPVAEHFSQMEQVQQTKIARNAVVGIARSTRNKWVMGPKIWYSNKVNKFLSPTLWAQLMGIVNQIAVKAIDLGAIWVNTDGYAFYEPFAADDMADWLLENGIDFRQSAGEGVINGISSMDVPGVKVTGEQNASPAINKVEKSDYNFLAEWQRNRENYE